jgi:hypothetical protein
MIHSKIVNNVSSIRWDEENSIDAIDLMKLSIYKIIENIGNKNI